METGFQILETGFQKLETGFQKLEMGFQKLETSREMLGISNWKHDQIIKKEYAVRQGSKELNYSPWVQMMWVEKKNCFIGNLRLGGQVPVKGAIAVRKKSLKFG